MKKNFFKRGMAGLLSLVMCLTALVGIGTTTAYAAGERAEVYLVSFPRSGDANIDYSGTWGHPNLRYMNGWHSGESKYTTIRAMHSYDGNICYCIEPGVQQDTGDTYTSKDETFWDNLPSDINSTISPYDIKLFIPLWAVTLIGGLFITVMSFILIMTVYGRFFKLYMYTALAPIPLSTFAGEPSQNVGKSFIKSYCAVCLEGAVIVLSCIIFSLFASSPPVVNPDAAAVTQVWSYIGELLFNMLVLVGSVKMSDRIIREMMGL